MNIQEKVSKMEQAKLEEKHYKHVSPAKKNALEKAELT